MSDSIHQWILKDLKQYAEDWGASMSRELMKPAKGRKCQFVKLITPPTDDPSAVVWGYVSDKECLIAVKFEDPKVIVLSESRKDNKPLSHYLGSVCTLRKITLKFTKVPLEGKIGLSDKDHLVLLVGEVTINGAKGEPAFRMDIIDEKGVSKRAGFIYPDDDPAIGRWVNGLRTGNGHILQMERMQKNGSVGMESQGVTASLTPPPTPRALASRINSKKMGKVSHDDWRMPADQMELIKRYDGRGPCTPASDVFSDEESDEGDAGIAETNNPKIERPSSPATIIYSGWSSTPMRAPAFAREDADDDDEEGEDGDDDLEAFEDTLGRNSLGQLVPCAQPPKPQSTFGLTFESVGTPKAEPFTQVLPATAPQIQEEVSQPSLSLSWPTFPSTLSRDPENTGPEQKDGGSQVSSVSTIEPTSSNNVSCSALCPPAQRSFKATESQESLQYTESRRASPAGSVSSSHSTAQSQLSELGGVGKNPVFEDDNEAEHRSVSHHSETEGEAAEDFLVDSITAFPDVTKRSPSPPRRPEVGSVFDHSEPSSVASRLRTSSNLDDLQLPKHKRPGLMPNMVVVPPLVRDGRSLIKRRMPECESSVEGSNKRLKSDQTVQRGRETSAASLFNNASATPRTSDHLIEESRSSSSGVVPRPLANRRPLLVGNGSDLTLWRALKGNPPGLLPQYQKANRPGSLLPNDSVIRLPLLDLRKIQPGVRRSDKYRKSQDPLSQ